MMSSKPRLVVPYGLKTLLEGLSRAVLRIQPNSIAQFGSLYFTELLQYREGHPCLDIKELVKEFQHEKVETWPEESNECDSKQMTCMSTEILQDAGMIGGGETPDEVCPKDQKLEETSQEPCPHRDISNTAVCPAGANVHRQLSVDKGQVPGQEDKEEVKCTTGPVVPGPEDDWKCEDEEAPPAIGSHPATPTQSPPTSPCSTHPLTPTPTPPASCPPTPTPSRPTTPTPSSPTTPAPSRQTSAAQERKGVDPEPIPPVPKCEGPPTPSRPELKQEAVKPVESVRTAPEVERTISKSKYEDIESVAAGAPCPVEPSVRAIPETERLISKPQDAPSECIISRADRAISKPQTTEVVCENAEKDISKSRPVSATQEKREVPPCPPCPACPPCPVKSEPGAPKAPERKDPVAVKSPERCKTPEKGERISAVSSKEKPDNVPEKVDRILSKTSNLPPAKVPAKEECVVPKVEKVKADPVPEKVERILSKTTNLPTDDPKKVDPAVSKPVAPKSEAKLPEKMDRIVSKPQIPPCDVTVDKVDRVLSKSNIPPENAVSAHTQEPPKEKPVSTPVSKVEVCPTESKVPSSRPTSAHVADVPSSRATSAHATDVPSSRATSAHCTDVPPSRATSANVKEMPSSRATSAQVKDMPSSRATSAHAKDAPSSRATSAHLIDARLSTEVCAQGPTGTYYDHQLPPTETSAYVPAQDNTVARIVRATSDTYANIEPQLVQGEQSAAFYGCQDATVERRLSSAGRGTEISSTPYQLPNVHYETPSTGMRHEGMDGSAPCYIEQIPQEIMVPSQGGNTQLDPGQKQPYSSSYQYQTIQSAPVQQQGYRSSADGQNYHPSYNQDVLEGMLPKNENERDQAKVWTLYCLTDLSQSKGGSQNPGPASSLYIQNPNEHSVTHVNQQAWTADQQGNPQFVQPMMPQMQRSNYMDSQHCPPNSRMVSSPAYRISEEAKRRMNAPPYILVGSNVQEAHDWKPIPGHTVLSKNELSPQRRYTTIPVPVAMSADGCAGRGAGQDMNIPGPPVYIAVPMDESQRMSASQSYTHVAPEQRAAPMTSYANSQGPTLAVAGAASRGPSSSAMCEQRNLSNARSGQQQ